MDRHCENALAVAKFLQGHKRVAWVNYPGLPDNKYHALARKYLPKGASGLLNFGVKGRAGRRALHRGGAVHEPSRQHRRRKTLVISRLHHAPADGRGRSAQAGVWPDMIRISVGIETLEDILWDWTRRSRRPPRHDQLPDRRARKAAAESRVKTPKPQGAEVLVRVTRAGVCHSDVHIWDGYFDLGGGKRFT